jgi:hypothetical protein
MHILSWVYTELLTALNSFLSFSTSLSLSFARSFTHCYNNSKCEWKKISSGLYLCVYNIMPFIQHNFFFISWALFCFLLTSQFSSTRQIVHTLVVARAARWEISRLYWEISYFYFTFCILFAFCYFTIFLPLFYLKVSERQEHFHRNFLVRFFLSFYYNFLCSFSL